MKLEPKVRFYNIGLLFVLLCLSCSCSGQRQVYSNMQDEQRVLTCIAVLPVAISGKEVDKSGLSQGVADFERILQEKLVSGSKLRFVTDEEFKNRSGWSSMGLMDKFKQVGEKYGCNGVLDFTLHRYRQRQGTSFGAKEPASVMFSWQLLDLESGRRLCFGRYDETQKSLSENLLDFGKAGKRGFSWVTAERLLLDGLQEQLSECSYLDTGN